MAISEKCRAAGIAKKKQASWQNFQDEVRLQGGVVLASEWLGSQTRHEAKCKNAHTCWPLPSQIRSGKIGICRTCANQDPDENWRMFKENIIKFGATVIQESYLGSTSKHEVMYTNSHTCWISPTAAKLNKIEICKICSGLDPVVLWNLFKDRVSKLGGTVLEDKYLGKDRPHKVVCKAGHSTSKRPSGLRDGQGLCLTCANKDPIEAENGFHERVENLGGTVLGKWINALTPTHVICRNGHDCYPRPGNIKQGRGICRFCSNKTWDIFYIVVNKNLNILKIGITSGDPRPRLLNHKSNGYEDIILIVNNPNAHDLENFILRSLRANKYSPSIRNEYFDLKYINSIYASIEEWYNE